MRLAERALQIHQIVTDLVAQLALIDDIVAGVSRPGATVPAPLPGGSPTAPGVPPVSIPAIRPDAPWIGPGTPTLRDELAKAAQIAQLSPETIEAICVHESNWSSHQWLGIPENGIRPPWNAAGIKTKDQATNESIGATAPDYVSLTSHTHYAGWPSWQEGVRGVGKFLARPIYNPARLTKDPHEQLERIGAVGYAAGNPEWIEGTLSVLDRIAARDRHAPAPAAPPAVGLTRDLALKRALDAPNYPIYYSMMESGEDQKSWTQEHPGLLGDGGKLYSDCSLFACWCFGVDRNKTGLNTTGIVNDARLPGGFWDVVPLSSPSIPGADVMVYQADPGHVGVVITVDASGNPTELVDCSRHHDRTGPHSIGRRGPEVWKSNGAIIARFRALA